MQKISSENSLPFMEKTEKSRKDFTQLHGTNNRVYSKDKIYLTVVWI